MKISDIQKKLKTSFKNGFYFSRPALIENDVVLYITKTGTAFQFQNNQCFKIEFMNWENEIDDWIIL